MKQIRWNNVDTWGDSVEASSIENEIWTLLIALGKNPDKVSFDLVVRYEEREG